MNKEITITLIMDQLKDDVRAKCYYIARTRATDSEKEALMQEINEEDNVDLMKRSFGEAIGIATNVISEYAHTPLTSANNALMYDQGNMVIHLEMPSNFNLGMTHGIAQLLHQMMVDKAAMDWCMNVSKEDVQMYSESLANDITSLRNAVSRRVRPERFNIDQNQDIPYVSWG